MAGGFKLIHHPDGMSPRTVPCELTSAVKVYVGDMIRRLNTGMTSKGELKVEDVAAGETHWGLVVGIQPTIDGTGDVIRI